MVLMRQRRRVGVASAAALVLAGAGVLATATSAQAAEVSYRTECLPPPISGLPPIEGTTKVAVSAPATAKVGDEVTVVWKTVEGASKNPDILDLGENTVQPTGTIKVAGAQSGDLPMQGPRQNPPIPKGAPMKLSDMTGKLKLEKPGEITLTPGFYNINVNKPISTDTKCSPKEAVKPAVTIKVTGGGGGTTGGSSGGATGGTASGGGTSGGTSGGGTSGGDTSGGSTGGSSGGSTGGTGGDPDGTAYKGKEVQVPYSCKTPIGDKKATSPVQINAVKKSGSYDLTVQFKKSVMNSPADIPKNSVKPSMDVKVGGADKGSVKVEGPTNDKPIKSGDPIEIPDLKGTYKPGATGKATLTPGVLTVNALGTTTVCTPDKDPGASLTLDTSAQQGGTSGGTTGGTGGASGGSAGGDTTGASTGATTGTTAGTTTGATGGSSGGLAATGASDHGTLTALGLLAGTAILLGGAVFAFTPRRYLRR
ncbi:hypothetical protein B1H19_16940 [Streptomyces gilvosporeus]|uniref:Gram-positive cocci surface proteins LPxTG domain-containing protein n=2 Tax=Streptomyces gilvosporeus TaxID=553510 RepID=A0A1V0U2T1_9ACTN|nr:hypothetical protein B1H19_16940 [Streptomyces gilvosporeus]